MRNCDEIRKLALALVLLFLLCLFLLVGCSPAKIKEGTASGVTDDSLTRVKESGKLVVGTYPVVEPMSFIDESGQITGYDIDVVKEIASQLGVTAEFKNILFQNLIESAKNSEIDLIACVLTITPERAEQVIFSIPYFSAGQTVVIREDSKFNSLDEIKLMKLGVQKGTTAEQVGMEYVDSSLLQVYENWNDALTDLDNGLIDAILIDYVLAFDYVKKNPSLRILGDPLSQEYFGFATRLGNDALMDEINRILRDMKRTGKLNEIKNKWLE